MINEKPLISIIIPVYNVEKYLCQCIDSVLLQTYTNIEIIMINDGSTDSSGDICDNYSKKDARITVIHKENGGVSSARNIGIEHAQGKYILFIDADDFIDVDYIEAMYCAVTKNNADIVCGNFTVVDESGIPIVGHSRSADGVAPNVKQSRLITEFSDCLKDITEKKEYYWSHVIASLIKTDIVKQCRFLPLKYYEDGLFLFDIFCTHPQVYLSEYAGYYYTIRKSSVTQAVKKFTLQSREDYVKLCFHEFTQLKKINSKFADDYLSLYAESIHDYTYAASQPENKRQWNNCRIYINTHIQYILPLLRFLPRNIRIYLRLYYSAPWLYKCIARINELIKG